jgi:ketosteroid isomerase-like protein
MTKILAGVEERTRRLEDRVEIEDVIQRYLLAIDDDDYDAMRETLSDDCVLQVGQDTAATGGDPVVSYMRQTRANMTGTVHTPHRALIEFESADLADVLVPAHVEVGQGGVTMFAASRYPMTVTRTAMGWRISSHQILTIHLGPWDDAINSLTADLRLRRPGQPPVRGDWPRAVTS